MNVTDKIRNKIRTFLKIEPADRQSFDIIEELDYHGNAIANRLWYRGNASELNQFYRQVNSDTCPFWGSIPTKGLEVRKIHTGIPKIIVNTLANIVIRDLNDIHYQNVNYDDMFSAVWNENKMDALLNSVLVDGMVIGDGAVKITFAPDLSDYPVIEWVPGDRCEYKYLHGRLQEITFRTEYRDKYVLLEHYGKGYIRYELLQNGNSMPLTELPETSKLTDVEFDESFMMAVQFKIYDSDRWKGRGQSLFDSKKDSFDALDEAWSQWIHAMRTSRPVKYIPDSLIPRNVENGKLMKPNPFDNQFVTVESNMSEGAKNEINIQQAVFPSESYNSTYITALDLSLQGLISPSTLGIDTKKLDNAEAQREKEKATLYTRGILVEKLTEFIKNLADTVFKTYFTANKMPLEEIETEVSFGEYANPSFEAVIETLSNPNTPMSIEAKVDEMWGDSKDETWKREEVARIKEQMGIVSMEEPFVGGIDYDNETR